MPLTLPDALAVNAKAGDGWALQELIRFHDRAIGMLAKRFASVAQSMGIDDLRQEAVVAIIELLPSWKPGCGSSFATYFFSFAPHRIRRKLDGTDLVVRVPAYVGLKQRRKYRATGETTMVQGVSLFKPSIDCEPDADLLDEVEATATQADHEQRDLVRYSLRLVDGLPKRERAVILEVTLKERTMQDVADLWGVTRQCVQQTHARAVERLQRMAHRCAPICKEPI